MYHANRVSFDQADDHAQDIRLHIFRYLDRFDPTKASLRYFVNRMIVTAFRKIVYDRRKQIVFEGSFDFLIGDVPYDSISCHYDEFLSKIVLNLKKDMRVMVFYAILYNQGEKPYTQIAKKLNMNYASFLNHVKQIREVTTKIIEEYK